LKDERDDQDAGHDQRRDRQTEAEIDGQIVGRGFAHGHRQELYQPEIDGDVRNPVKHWQHPVEGRRDALGGRRKHGGILSLLGVADLLANYFQEPIIFMA
jgi:hypothetical protein